LVSSYLSLFLHLHLLSFPTRRSSDLPQYLFIIPAFIFVAACSVSLSIKLIRKIFIRQTFSFQLVPVFSRYVLAYIATILVITIAASIEAYLTPALMKAIIAGF